MSGWCLAMRERERLVAEVWMVLADGPAQTERPDGGQLQCCQSFGFYPNSTDFEGLVLCLFYAYSDFSDGFSVC